MNFLIAMLMLGYLTYHIPKGGEKDSISNYFNISAYLKKVNEGITRWYRWTHSVQFSSIAQSCPILCDPMNCSTTSLPVHHQLLEFTQTHVHQIGDAIQPSHPLWSPSPPNFNLCQHPGLLKRVSSSHQVAKVLEFQLQHQSFQWIFSTDCL